MDFSHSAKAQDFLKRTQAFMNDKVLPAEEAYHQALSTSADHSEWQQPEIVEELKRQARSAGLWNMFLPCDEWGAGLTNTEYAPIAEATGWSLMSPEVFNCNAPDTGNAEVLWKYGSEEQKEQWLKPLLAGEIRSAFCMTEPEVASSDATNMGATCVVEGDEIVLNGRKWWSSGIGHPNCKFVIFMGISNPDADRHHRHAMVLVPLATPGIKSSAC
ncbi:acyl-CoA dehydrogenase family protein [Endozoicomonas sp. GU-1]|uniref:acyl-CoA dehydrogenase family protein n=1 Tax=Endozoicomonas sp. GU-1 TaxID=3009078 RepID=UPI003FA48DB0